MRIPRPVLPVLLLALLCTPASGKDGAEQQGRFACGGEVEAEVWATWDGAMRAGMQRLLRERLARKGDVYALYDFQVHTHNMVSMARRCRRTDRLAELSRIIRVAYEELEPGLGGRRWICGGGGHCTIRNGHLGREVKLNSAQFLAVASAVANALADSGAPLDAQAKRYITDTAEIVAEHLDRWGSDAYINELRKLRRARPEDVRSGSSALGFKDYHAWQITLYAELAGLPGRRLADPANARMRRHIDALLQLLSARITFRTGQAGRKLADLDRGYWRLHADNRYAAYESEASPVACTGGEARERPETRAAAASVRVRGDIGWDFSHMRRMVHAFDALERNRAALRSVFGADPGPLASPATQKAFAATLIAKVWNQDRSRPLFSNYWSGANGWYRVAYDNGTGRCTEGYGPYGLTNAFLTGGYVTWGRHDPLIARLGERMYELSRHAEGRDAEFIARHYPHLGKETAGAARTRLMFLPSLVGTT